MYMYYLLGYRIIRMSETTVLQALDSDRFEQVGWDQNKSGRSEVFKVMDKQVKRKVNHLLNKYTIFTFCVDINNRSS